MGFWRQIIFESRCAACSGPMPGGVFCSACLKGLPPRQSSFCPICGEIFPGGVEGLCPACQQQAPPWGKIYFHGLYDGLLRDLILRLKFGKELHLARALAALLLGHAKLREEAAQYDCIVPVPLHPSRLHERGFNQAGEIARELGRGLNIPVRHLVARTLPTRHQVGLSRRERVKNLRGAFMATGANGKSILLLDDIMTTGATLGFAARSLLDTGAAKVDVIVPARTRARNMLRESRNL